MPWAEAWEWEEAWQQVLVPSVVAWEEAWPHQATHSAAALAAWEPSQEWERAPLVARQRLQVLLEVAWEQQHLPLEAEAQPPRHLAARRAPSQRSELHRCSVAVWAEAWGLAPRPLGAAAWVPVRRLSELEGWRSLAVAASANSLPRLAHLPLALPKLEEALEAALEVAAEALAAAWQQPALSVGQPFRSTEAEIIGV